MNKKELNPRQPLKTGTDVTINQKQEKLAASLVDICQDCVVIISKEKILPGTEVEITVDDIDDFAILGKINLVLLDEKEGKSQYRLGVEADQILGPEDVLNSIPLEPYNEDRVTLLTLYRQSRKGSGRQSFVYKGAIGCLSLQASICAGTRLCRHDCKCMQAGLPVI